MSRFIKWLSSLFKKQAPITIQETRENPETQNKRETRTSNHERKKDVKIEIAREVDPDITSDEDRETEDEGHISEMTERKHQKLVHDEKMIHNKTERKVCDLINEIAILKQIPKQQIEDELMKFECRDIVKLVKNLRRMLGIEYKLMQLIDILKTPVKTTAPSENDIPNRIALRIHGILSTIYPEVVCYPVEVNRFEQDLHANFIVLKGKTF
jgi:hypothetical protein